MRFGAIGYGILATSDRNIMDKNKFQTYIEGNSAEFSATGAIGGDISIGKYGPMVALRGGAEVGLTAGVGHSFYLGSIIQ